MSKLKHGLWVVALVLALAAPPVWAEETSAAGNWLDDLVAQIVAVVMGEEPAGAVQGAPAPGGQAELGELVPVNG